MSFSLQFLKSQKKTSALQMAVDVGSRYIHAVVFEKELQDNEPEKPVFRIIKKIIKPLASLHKASQVSQRLHEVIFEATKDLGRLPSVTWATFSPELVETSLESWNISLATKAEMVTPKELRNYFNNIAAEPGRIKPGNDARPVQFFFNGYAIDPFTFRGKRNNAIIEEVGFRVLVSEFKEDALKEMQEIRRMLGGVAIEYVPSAFLLKECITGMLKMDDALMIDVGETHTELLFIYGREFKGIAHFPFGSNHFVEAFPGDVTTRSAGRDAGELRHRYEEGAMEDNQKAAIRPMLDEAAETWKKELMKTLTLFYPAGPIPEYVLLSGIGARMPEIRKVVTEGNWMEEASFVQKPRCALFEPERMLVFDSKGQTIHGLEETGIATLMYFAAHHNAKDEMTRIQ